MSRAQKIHLASILMLQRIRKAGIVIPNDIVLEFYRRVERWCVEAQVKSPA